MAANRLALSIASNWVALVINVAISFFLAPFVVNRLGSTWYGVWAVVMQFTGYLYLLDFGVRESVIRYTSKYVTRRQGRRLNQVLTVAFGVYAPVMALCVLASVLLAWAAPAFLKLDPAFHWQARLTVLLVGLTIAQTFVFNVFTGILFGLQRWSTNNFIGIVVGFVRTAAIVVALQAGHGIVAMSAIQLVTAIVSGGITWMLAVKYLKEYDVRLQLIRMSLRRFRLLASRVFRYGVFVLANNLGQKLIVASDAIIIAALMPVSAVTYFAIAGSLIDPLRTLLATTAHAFMPLASQMHAAGERDRLAEAAMQVSKLVTIITLPVAVTFMILGERFIGLWMGQQFAAQSGTVLAILAVAVLLSTPSFVLNMTLYGISRHNLSAYVKMAEAATNVVLSVLLVRKFGLVGAAMGSALPHAISNFLVLPWVACRAIGYPLGAFLSRTFALPMLAALPFALALLVVRRSTTQGNLVEFFAVIAATTCLYLVAVYFVALTETERRWVKSRLPGSAVAAR